MSIRREDGVRLENVDTKMNREQRLHMVVEHLKMKLYEKKVEYPDEEGSTSGYSKGVPGDILTDDFVDIVLFCALLTNNLDVKNFEFSNNNTSNMAEDYKELKAKTLELIKELNGEEGTDWLRKKGFISGDKGKWTHLYAINQEWGFNVDRDHLIELGINFQIQDKQREEKERATETFDGVTSGKEIESNVHHRYFFTLFFSRLRELYKGESDEERMARAKKIIGAMVEANLGFNENGGRKAKKYYPLCQMILDDTYGIKECTIAELVQKWREIEK